ncbi:MAG: hypothetical protein KIS66_16750 [Fimbriimonadaceae bacterium]|nr:hypothetical protein [Fimbriimonadaceae bacterium]
MTVEDERKPGPLAKVYDFLTGDRRPKTDTSFVPTKLPEMDAAPDLSPLGKLNLEYGEPLPVPAINGKDWLIKGITHASRITDPNVSYMTVGSRFRSLADTTRGILEQPEDVPEATSKRFYQELRTAQEDLAKLAEQGPQYQQRPDELLRKMLERMVPEPVRRQMAGLDNMDPGKRNRVIGSAIGALLSGNKDWARFVTEPLEKHQKSLDEDAKFQAETREANAKRAQLEYQYIVGQIDRSDSRAVEEWKRKLGAQEHRVEALDKVRKLVAEEKKERRELVTKALSDLFKVEGKDARAAYLEVLVSQGVLSQEYGDALREAVSKETPDEAYREQRLKLSAADLAAKQRHWAETYKLEREKLGVTRRGQDLRFTIDQQEVDVRRAVGNAQIADAYSRMDYRKWQQLAGGEAAGFDAMKEFANSLQDAADEDRAIRRGIERQLEDERDALNPDRDRIAALEERLDELDERVRVRREQRQRIEDQLRKAKTSPAPSGAPVWEQDLRPKPPGASTKPLLHGQIGPPPKTKG